MLEIHTFVAKSALLAKAGHDLALSVDAPSLVRRGDAFTATVDLTTLRVLGAVEVGKIQPHVLSKSDKQKIVETAKREVLETSRHPHAVFDGHSERSEDRVVLSGELTLAGRCQALRVELRVQGNRLIGGFQLAPSSWGIRPYSALFGALKLEDRVDVLVDFPL